MTKTTYIGPFADLCRGLVFTFPKEGSSLMVKITQATAYNLDTKETVSVNPRRSVREC